MSEAQNETGPRRGRPGISDGQRTEMRQQIADVAKRLFQEEGYGQVSIRRIAGEIGCSPMTLYKYYDAKIDILRTLWAGVIGDVFDSIDALELDASTPRERLQAAASAYVRYWLDNTEQYRLVFMADGVTQPDVSLFVDNPEIVARYGFFATTIIDAYNSELDSDRLKLKLDALICFLHGIAHNLITISGYPWATADAMISVAVSSVMAE